MSCPLEVEISLTADLDAHCPHAIDSPPRPRYAYITMMAVRATLARVPECSTSEIILARKNRTPRSVYQRATIPTGPPESCGRQHVVLSNETE